MRYHVIVSFGEGRAYPFEFSSSELAECSPEDARRWFDREFLDLRCEATSPTGKVLIIDKILSIARNGGESRFQAGQEWARQFARYTALALARETVRIDVQAFHIGY